jgi:hypothetical protein
MTALEAIARLAALAQRDLPETWIPSSDDPMIIGEFLRIEQGPTVHGPAWIVVLKTDDGRERSVWLLHTVLRHEFARHRPRRGEYVLIKHEGTKQGATGQSYEAYRVIVDREQSPSDWDAVTATDGMDPASPEPTDDEAPF